MAYHGGVNPPASRNKMDKMGKRLASEGRVLAEDHALFAAVLDYYQEILDGACEELVRAGFLPTSRVKTTGTLTDKLQREHGIQLSRINDIAGARIVIKGSRLDQDMHVERIRQAFLNLPKPPLVIDRRAEPRQGYRALHIIIYPDGVPVEIQVRTELQDAWAQIFERLADQWGRQMRYGGEPDDIILPIAAAAAASVNLKDVLLNLIEILNRLSDAIDLIEQQRAHLHESQRAFDALVEPPYYPSPASEEELQELAALYAEHRRIIIERLQLCEKDSRRRGRIIRRYLKRNQPDLVNLFRAYKIVASATNKNVLKSLEENQQAEKELRDTLEIMSSIPDLSQILSRQVGSV